MKKIIKIIVFSPLPVRGAYTFEAKFQLYPIPQSEYPEHIMTLWNLDFPVVLE